MPWAGGALWLSVRSTGSNGCSCWHGLAGSLMACLLGRRKTGYAELALQLPMDFGTDSRPGAGGPMKLIELELSDLVVSEELSRSGSAKQFEERLKSSIEEIGLAEPIKVAPLPTGKYVVVDGTMRLKAIAALRKQILPSFR